MEAIFIFIAIIWMVINFFSNAYGENQRDKQPKKNVKPVRHQQETRNPNPEPERKLEPEEAFFKHPEPEDEPEESRFQEKLEQLERDKQVYDALPDYPSVARSVRPGKMDSRVSMQKQMTRKRIVESIIMSEVLGPPRARQPLNSQLRKK